jgi:uncharacterized repeat protein (TIGR04076 family)
MPKIKITVLRKMANPDIAEEYMKDKCRREALPCRVFEDGQEFLIESGDSLENGDGLPKGFCAWAWADIQKYVLALMCGGNFDPWVKEKGTAIACCTDGYRPVVFKIEAIE